jgi:hypothetical protein
MAIAVQIKIVTHSQTWIEDYYTVEKLEWSLRHGKPSERQAAKTLTETCNTSNMELSTGISEILMSLFGDFVYRLSLGKELIVSLPFFFLSLS